MKKEVKNAKIWLSVVVSLILLMAFMWFALQGFNAYGRSLFPSVVAFVKTSQYQDAAWSINGKEYALHEFPQSLGCIIEVESWNSVRTKQPLGGGFYILYDSNSMFEISELRFMNFKINECCSASPVKCEEFVYCDF